MESLPSIFFSILQSNENDIYKIEFFLTYPVSNWTNQVFWYTKRYHLALDFLKSRSYLSSIWKNITPRQAFSPKIRNYVWEIALL